mmetsp:Transcript_17206/g.36101  ORF Transcript_17206/g.36101 Transcript_17206/m.36101 type:complete len:125 (-) Transcript_17206:400-774(-)
MHHHRVFLQQVRIQFHQFVIPAASVVSDGRSQIRPLGHFDPQFVDGRNLRGEFESGQFEEGIAGLDVADGEGDEFGGVAGMGVFGVGVEFDGALEDGGGVEEVLGHFGGALEDGDYVGYGGDGV